MKKMKKMNCLSKALCAVLVCVAMLMGPAMSAVTEEAYAEGFSLSFSKSADYSKLFDKGYYGLQATAFDTYTGKDGYSFAETNNGKKMQLVHFTMNSKGKCKKKKAVVYKTSQVGHANDACIYRDETGTKWLIFTLYGSTDDSRIKVNGEKADLAAIKLSDFNKGKAKIYLCDVSSVLDTISSGGRITGITYAGEQTIGEDYDDSDEDYDDSDEDYDYGDEDYDDSESYEAAYGIESYVAPVFVFHSGNKLAEATVDPGSDTLYFAAVGERTRIVKNGSFSYQGVTYHNGYLYFCGEKGESTKMLIERIRLDRLFNGYDSEKSLQSVQKNIKKQGSVKLTKNAPEAVFFTNLDGSSKMYVSVNRKKAGSGNMDAIIRTSQKF